MAKTHTYDPSRGAYSTWATHVVRHRFFHLLKKEATHDRTERPMGFGGAGIEAPEQGVVEALHDALNQKCLIVPYRFTKARGGFKGKRCRYRRLDV